MNFEEELNKRTLKARTKMSHCEHALDTPRKKYLEQFKLTIKTKSVINRVFNKLVDHYPNAEVELTHRVDEITGETCPLMWTFDCCFLNFAKNSVFDFPLPARLAVKVILSFDLTNIKLVSGLVCEEEAIKKDSMTYRKILNNLRYNKNYFYDGPFIAEDIKGATEAETLELLDKYQEISHGCIGL